MSGKTRITMLIAGTVVALTMAVACSPAAAPAPTAAPAKPATEATKAPAAPAASTSAPAAAAPSGGTIKIGFTAPLTGDQALFGKTFLNGVMVAVNETNAAGGVLGKKIEVTSLDDQADPKQGPVVAQRLADDKSIVGVIGPFNSGVAIPAAPVYNKARLVNISMATNPKVTTLGFDTFFRTIANDNIQGGTPAEYFTKKLNAKKAAIVHDKQAFGQGVSDVFEKQFKALGGTVTSVNGITATDTDFSAVVTKIKGENPDVIQYGGTHVAGGLLLKQLRAQGLKQPFMAPDGCYTPEFIQVAGDAAEGAMVTFQIPPYDTTPATQKFAADYKKTFNEDPGPYSGSGYDMAAALIAGIKGAGSDNRDAIVKATHAVKMNGLYGPIEFDATGEVKQPAIFVFQVKNGKFELVK
ncbi:MAG TPA: branched-chain amino acid ABC transporter substrate-binding protein [Chloroflexota bacterium]|nr:branched-chain amino acid ABC transporter substrate-binding protein [Chloroflexota bacterium]